MKRRVLPPNLRSNFTWHRRYFYLKNNIYFNSHLFSTLNFFLVAIVSSVVLGIWNPVFWALGASLLSYLLFAWFRTEKLASGLQIKRILPTKGREGEEFLIHYDVSNSTGFHLPAFSFKQNFEGVQDGFFDVNCSRIPPQTRERITRKVTLDAGMGIKEIGHFMVLIHDELSLFPYRVEFSGTEEVEVYPLVLETPQLKKSISPDSTEFGFYDVQKRGESNLFIGTREYRHGDPVKHINWKLSKKSRKLIVNEFEKNTNTFITLLLDLELSSQVGLGSVSTWEAAKDLALSIAANEIRQRNYVQVLAQDLYLPFGTGETQLISVERHFTYHELSKSGLTHLKHLEALPSQSQIYFFCPLLATSNVMETIRLLKQLKQQGMSVTVFGLDPFQEMKRAVTNQAHLPIRITGDESRKQFQAISEDLRKAGIAFVTIDVNKAASLKATLVDRARHLLEVRFQ